VGDEKKKFGIYKRKKICRQRERKKKGEKEGRLKGGKCERERLKK
jgi:hypothetical protein